MVVTSGKDEKQFRKIMENLRNGRRSERGGDVHLDEKRMELKESSELESEQ